jgi:hypothetical protein
VSIQMLVITFLKMTRHSKTLTRIIIKERRLWVIGELMAQATTYSRDLKRQRELTPTS